MNALEEVEHQIQKELPNTWRRLRRPRNPEGEWWLDARLDEHTVTIQWSPRRGFGVSASFSDEGFGEGPEEVFDNPSEVSKRVVTLLASRGYTQPPTEVALRELRALFGVTQEQLAGKLGVQQAAVSRFERREDFTMASLRRYVSAMGASLDISVRTPKGETLHLVDPSKPVKHRLACHHVDASNWLVCEPTCGSGKSNLLVLWVDLVRAVRARWTLPDVDLQFSAAPDAPLATCDSDRWIVLVNSSRVSELAAQLSRTRCSTRNETSARIPIEQTFRHIFAHELGHLISGRDAASDKLFCGLPNEELRADAVAGWVAEQLGESPSVGACLSSWLGCREKDCSHPTPEERSFAYLSGFLESKRERIPSSRMSLVVLRSSNLERSREFYSNLGLRLRQEQHERGPLHYSCTVDGTVFELYPCSAPNPRVRLGMTVPATRKLLASMVSSGLLRNEPAFRGQGTGSPRCVIEDPDGNTLDLELGEGPEHVDRDVVKNEAMEVHFRNT